MTLIAHQRLYCWEGFYASFAGTEATKSLEELNLSASQLSDHADNAAKFLQNGIASFIQLLFSTVESSIRNFARELHPEYANTTEEFKSLYTEMIKDCFAGSHQQQIDFRNRYTKFLNLFAMLRNTIHNNGIFFNDEPENPIKWNGQEFIFKWEKPVHLTWDHFKVITEGVLETMDKIVRSTFISNSDLVNDPTPSVSAFNILN